MEAIKTAGYEGKCEIGMDVAASEFKVEGEDCYDLGTFYPPGERDDPSLKMTAAQLADFYADLCREFPIVTIEDAFDQDDWSAWSNFSPKVKATVQTVGDDLTVTNVAKISEAIDKEAATATPESQPDRVPLESIDAARCRSKRAGAS